MSIIEKKIQDLPPDLQNEVIDFIDYLINKKMVRQKGKRPFGLCHGQIKIADDFNNPIDDETLESWGML
ncbi:MAG: DUF2281 domain-containing protein [Spirochaetales bacterium]|nr:DUF2281 domain-containing protein [Spirochaetales bacterium]